MTAARDRSFDTHLQHLRDWLADDRQLVLAVSGGADSMALMHAVTDLVPPERARQLLVATVDHGLRSGSRAEAEQVGQWAATRGLSHRLLIWHGSKPVTAVEEQARAARYALLVEAAQSIDAVAIVTAHNANDQAETLLMRLARGSGVEGLAGMAMTTRRDGVLVHRPLLAVPHADLVAFLTAHQLSWIEDPSNANPAFERVRLRQANAVLADLGLTSAPLALSARRLGRTRHALAVETDRIAGLVGSSDATGAVTLDRPAWQACAEEMRLRLLARALLTVTGDTDPISLAALEEAETAISTGAAGRSLHGALILANRNRLMVIRELARIAEPPLALAPGAVTLWDRRFVVAQIAKSAEPLTLRLADATELKPWLALTGTPLRLAAVTPVIANAAGHILAAPCLGHDHADVQCRRANDWLAAKAADLDGPA